MFSVLYPMHHYGLIGNDSACIKGDILGFFRTILSKIGTSVDEEMKCQSKYQIRKRSIKGLKMRKLNDTEKFTWQVLFQ